MKEDLLKNVVPKMALLAIELPNEITCGVHLLKSQMNASITLSRKQCACLLANAFFCTFPKRNSFDDPDEEYDSYPFINFTGYISSFSCALHQNKILFSKIDYFAMRKEKEGIIQLRLK